MTETLTEPSSLICENDEKKIFNNQKDHDREEKVEKKFITSPADIEVHRKVVLQDADVSKEQKTGI